MVALDGKVTGLVGDKIPNNATGETEGYYFGKNNVDRLNHGIKLGVGAAGGSVEHTWEPSEIDPKHRTTLSGSFLVFEGETTLQDTQTPNPTKHGIHLDGGFKVAIIFGLKIKLKLGITHD